MAGNKVTMLVGFVPLNTRFEPAVDEDSSGLRTVCLGTEAEPHDVVRVQSRMTCPTCDRFHSSVFGYKDRASEDGDKLVVLSYDDIVAAKGVPITGKPDTPVAIAFHPREKVYGATVAGDSVQNVYPERGYEKAYVLLRDTLLSTPDVVACIVYAPRSANALWVLEVVGDRIVASKRAWPEYVRATSAIPDAVLSDVERDMFAQLVEGSLEDFDLSIYSDRAKLGVDELVKARAAGAVPAASAAPATNQVGDLLAALNASIQAVKKTPAKKTAARKAPAKKAVAKKTAAKKTTTRKRVA